MFENMFEGMFKPIKNGCCKLSMDGKMAIKTKGGFKTYDPSTNRLVNCDNFAFDMNGAFWVIPVFKVEAGDIILVNDRPRHVIEVKDSTIKTFSYEDSTIEEIVPEYHVFMGKTYCYGKIFSPFANMIKSDNGMNNIMTMFMMSKMFGNDVNSNDLFGGINPMMFMMMNNGGGNMFTEMFNGAFNFGEEVKNEDK